MTIFSLDISVAGAFNAAARDEARQDVDLRAWRPIRLDLQHARTHRRMDARQPRLRDQRRDKIDSLRRAQQLDRRQLIERKGGPVEEDHERLAAESAETALNAGRILRL